MNKMPQTSVALGRTGSLNRGIEAEGDLEDNITLDGAAHG
jgi:hypothetical protein